MATIQSKRDIEDFVKGCTLLGTGGGGFPEKGRQYLEQELEERGLAEWVDMSEVSDDEWTATAYGMGSTSPVTDEDKRAMELMEMIDPPPQYKREVEEAVKYLERYTGKAITTIVPVEIGAYSTPRGIAAANHLGKKVVDGDYGAGRSVPELPQITPASFGVSTVPLASVDRWGNHVLIEKVFNARAAEEIGKAIASATFGLAGNCTYLIPGKKMKECIAPGNLTLAWEIGKAIWKARNAGQDPIQAVIDYTGGWELFEGRCVEKDITHRWPRYTGTHFFEGSGDFEGQQFKIWFTNENIMTWLNDGVYVTVPDYVTVVEAETCEPTVNPDVVEGKNYAVLGMKAQEICRSGKAMEVLSPRHFGYDMEWKPIEEWMR